MNSVCSGLIAAAGKKSSFLALVRSRLLLDFARLQRPSLARASPFSASRSRSRWTSSTRRILKFDSPSLVSRVRSVDERRCAHARAPATQLTIPYALHRMLEAFRAHRSCARAVSLVVFTLFFFFVRFLSGDKTAGSCRKRQPCCLSRVCLARARVCVDFSFQGVFRVAPTPAALVRSVVVAALRCLCSLTRRRRCFVDRARIGAPLRSTDSKPSRTTVRKDVLSLFQRFE